jgi:hypothetical protein
MSKKLGTVFTVVEGMGGRVFRHNLNGLTTVFVFCIWEFINRKSVPNENKEAPKQNCNFLKNVSNDFDYISVIYGGRLPR